MYKTLPIGKKDKKSSSKRIGLFALAFFIVFPFGFFAGQGRISLGNRLARGGNANKELPSNLDLSSVEKLYDALKLSFDGELKTEDLIDGAKKGLVKAAGDPYTEFFNESEAKDFNDSLNGTFSGIGAELTKEKEQIIVVSPIAGYPAEKAGLRAKDVVVSINGETTAEMSVSEAVSKIRGPEGTKVKLKVVRDGKQEIELEIPREKITIPSVEYSINDKNIGIIKINRFGEDTAKLTKQAADEFKAKGVKGVILDMRGNPGGLLDAAVDVSSLWLEKGKLILDEKRGGEVVKSFKSNGASALLGVPTVVLIDEGSASASEITAGALKDHKAATLIGVTSFGKGSVQQLSELQAGGVLKVTIARWFTPAGKNIDKEGIEPDVKVERTAEDFKNKRDPQLDAAINYLNK